MRFWKRFIPLTHARIRAEVRIEDSADFIAMSTVFLSILTPLFVDMESIGFQVLISNSLAPEQCFLILSRDLL